MKELIYPPEGGVLYDGDYTINGRSIKRLVISNHYKKKHAKYVNDELIKQFITDYLQGERFYNGKRDGEWEYFVTEPISYQGKNYKLIWVLHDAIPDFLGIVNCCASKQKLKQN